MAGFVKVLNTGDPATDLTGTAYRILIVDSAGDVVELAHGTDGNFLKSGGASADPSWAAASVANIDDVGDVTVTSVVEGEVLKMDGASTWINQTLAEAGIAATSHGTHLTEDSVGATEIDDTSTTIAFNQLILTPKSDGDGTVEGTCYFDTEDKHIYVYVA